MKKMNGSNGAGLLCLACLVLPLLDQNADTHAFRHQAEQAYYVARLDHAKQPETPEPAWKLARACFNLAEYSTNKHERARLAKEGIEVCRSWVEKEARSGPLHYYLALNLGQLARTKTLGALSLVREMEELLLTARQLRAEFDHGGVDRALGLLYLDAPGWPASVGNAEKARTHLKQAQEHAPLYPGNHLALIKAYLKWEEVEALGQAMERYRQIVPKAREQFQGEEWADDWFEWETRWAQLRREATEVMEE